MENKSELTNSNTPGLDVEPASTSIRTGVFICDCGGAVSSRLDTESLCQHALEISPVVYATRGNYPCSKDGLIRLTQAIREHDLDQVVVAGCTPRLVEKLFRQAAQNAGLDASRLEVVNVREHCAWVHPAQSPAALQKACEIVEMGVQRLSASNCPPVYSARTVQSALIVGSGLGGLAAALTLARAGLPVLLIEDGSDIGPTLLQAGDQTKETLQRYRQALASQPMIRIHG